MKCIPAPADFVAGEFRVNLLGLLPSLDKLMTSSAALHEWLGMAGYRLRGRISRWVAPDELCS